HVVVVDDASRDGTAGLATDAGRAVELVRHPENRGVGAAIVTGYRRALALGSDASSELRYFASVRVETALARVRWNGPPGHFAELAGYDVRAVVRKHKRAAPGASALIACLPFEDRAPLVAIRERTLDAVRPRRRNPGVAALGG
ncbi:MAG: glycosyltransferase, partial [Candidatus Velthaea sp.]